MNERKTALEILRKTMSSSSYSNLLMRSHLNSDDNIGFITNLVYGVLENYDSLKYQLNGLYKKTSKVNEIIMVMSLYERFILKKEIYVSINEYVKLADNEYDKSFINAVLHKIMYFKEPDEPHIKYNLSKWIYKLLSKQYPEYDLSLILNNLSRKKQVYYHINHNKTDFNSLKHLNIDIINDDFFTCKDSLLKTEEFYNGLFYVQDINSAKIVDSLDLQENDLFLDACSAPGSKLFNALKYIKQENAYSNDVNINRVKLINEKAQILGFDRVNYSAYDARELSEYIDIKFDKILLDVPCSGLGVISRKPDIKFHITDSSLDELQDIQKDILDNASSLLKEYGLLCYSTCTLNRKENSVQIDKFLKKHKEFVRVKEETITDPRGDMFYYCLIKHNK